MRYKSLENEKINWQASYIKKNRSSITEPHQKISLPHTQQRSPLRSKSGDKLGQFMNYLSAPNHLKRQKSINKHRNLIQSQMKNKVLLMRAQAQKLREDIRTKNRISDQLRSIQDAINSNKRISQPHYLPIYPIFQQSSPRYPQFQQKYYKRKKHQQIGKSEKVRRMKKYSRYHNHEALRKKFRKSVIAVLFPIFLKKQARGIKKLRQQYFYSFWPKRLKILMNEARNWFQNLTKSYYLKILKTTDLDFSILPQKDSKQICKIKSTKGLNVALYFYQNLYQNIQKFGIPPDIAKLIHGFCKHGAFLVKGVLTREQVKLSSFSENQGYCRMNQCLQRVQIIHFFFLKLVLFNSLLRAQSYTQMHKQLKIDKKDLQSNIFVIGSIIYHICLHQRDEYLIQNQKVKNMYPLNNWNRCRFTDNEDKSMKKVICCQSLKYRYCAQQDKNDGEIIAGLMKIQKFQQYYHPAQRYSNHTKLLQKIIKIIHEKIKEVHREYKQSILNN